MSSSGRSPGFRGKGWAFPPTFDPVFRTVQMAEGVADIEQNLRILLETDPGERSMLPDFGCPFSQFLFAEINPVTLSELRDAVRRAILKYEPRIHLDEVQVHAPETVDGQVLISIDYTVLHTNSRHNFVYPFSLVEGTGLVR